MYYWAGGISLADEIFVGGVPLALLLKMFRLTFLILMEFFDQFYSVLAAELLLFVSSYGLSWFISKILAIAPSLFSVKLGISFRHIWSYSSSLVGKKSIAFYAPCVDKFSFKSSKLGVIS